MSSGPRCEVEMKAIAIEVMRWTEEQSRMKIAIKYRLFSSRLIMKWRKP